MHSFLKAEWKTMLAVVVFCGAIYGWFYHAEVEKARALDAPYVFECLRAGDGFLDYKLGTPLQALEPQLQSDGFARSRDELFNVTRYARPDGAVALSFRDDKLAAIEFYPEKTENNPSCTSDIVKWRASQRPVAQEIVANDRQFVIYDGLVEIKQSDPVSGEDKPTYHDFGWLVLAR